MSTVFEHRALGDANEPIYVVASDDDIASDEEMISEFGDAIETMEKAKEKDLNAHLVDLIRNAQHLSVEPVEANMEKKMFVVFQLFTLWRATAAMFDDTRKEIFREAQTRLFKDAADDRKKKPQFKNGTAEIAHDVLEEMIDTVSKLQDGHITDITDRDYCYDYISDRFFF